MPKNFKYRCLLFLVVFSEMPWFVIKRGIDAFFPILREVVSQKDAVDSQNAKQNMADAAEQAFRMIQTFSTYRG